jgi:hypothetical protein
MATRMQELQASRRGNQWQPRVKISVGNALYLSLPNTAGSLVAKRLAAREGRAPYRHSLAERLQVTR